MFKVNYIHIKEAAEKWGITPRRVQDLCKNGAIPGVTKFGRAWMIPDNAVKPADGRLKSTEKLTFKPLPRRNPMLVFTDLYNMPGTVDDVINSLAEDNVEAAKLMRSQFDYQQGNIDKIYEKRDFLLNIHDGFNAVISGGLNLCQCAVWRGDVALWRKARKHICEAPYENEEQRQTIAFWLAVGDSAIYDTTQFPEWFRYGIFDCLHPDSYGVARTYYAKYLFISAHDLARLRLKLQDVEGMGLMKTLPYIIEPMISQAKIEHTLLAEIYLRLLGATVYHYIGNEEKAVLHLDKAIEMCLPDKLYSPLVGYRTNLDTLLDERLAIADENALKKVKEMHKRMTEGWTKLHNLFLERNVSTALTARERQVARLAAFGMQNAEIAKRLNIELSSVKRYIFSAMNKVGAEKRGELGMYV